MKNSYLFMFMLMWMGLSATEAFAQEVPNASRQRAEQEKALRLELVKAQRSGMKQEVWKAEYALQQFQLRAMDASDVRYAELYLSLRRLEERLGLAPDGSGQKPALPPRRADRRGLGGS